MRAPSAVTLVEQTPRRGHIHLVPSSPTPVASSSRPPQERKTTDAAAPYIPPLPPLAVLQTWVHRPQAVAKCTISDVYRMRAITPSEEAGTGYGSRDLFLLDHFPCRSVELVGWVAGVDHKDSSMTVYLDDGDGQHVMPVLVKLTLVTVVQPISRPDATSPSKQDDASTTRTFASAKVRKAQRRQAALAEAAAQAAKRARHTTYERPDVRVGDVVRIVGKIEEWRRRHYMGDYWVRQVVVADAAGGSIAVVDPDEESRHLIQVQRLHQTVYSQPFELPPAPLPQPPRSVASSPVKPGRGVEFSDSMMPSSEFGGEADYEEPVAALRDPAKLHSKQLTDTTFRQYMLDHMTQSILAALKLLSPYELRDTLSATFPEYRTSLAYVESGGDASRSRSSRSARQPPEILSISTRANVSRSSSSSTIAVDDADCTPTPKRFRSKAERLSTASVHSQLPTSTCSPSMPEGLGQLESFSVDSILAVPTLAQLGGLVVNAESRRSEKRRRKRIAEGSASQADLSIDAAAYKLSPETRDRRRRRLVQHVIRHLSEEGFLVACATATTHPGGAGAGTADEGYLTLPPELLGPLLLVFLREQNLRERSTFGRKGEKRGVWDTDKVCRRLVAWGQDGRWERVGRWAVEDALRWAEGRGLVLSQEGGWVLS